MDRRAVRCSTVGVAVGLQLAITALILRTPVGAAFFVGANDAAVAFIGYADRGIDLVFGRWPDELLGPEGEPVRLPFVGEMLGVKTVIHEDREVAREAIRGGLSVFAHFSGFAGMDVESLPEGDWSSWLEGWDGLLRPYRLVVLTTAVRPGPPP